MFFNFRVGHPFLPRQILFFKFCLKQEKIRLVKCKCAAYNKHSREQISAGQSRYNGCTHTCRWLLLFFFFFFFWFLWDHFDTHSVPGIVVDSPVIDGEVTLIRDSQTDGEIERRNLRTLDSKFLQQSQAGRCKMRQWPCR